MRLFLFLSAFLYSGEAFVGTYGGYTLGKKGYAIYTPINIGYTSDPKAEENRLKQRQNEAAVTFKRDGEFYQKLFDHYATGDHPYRACITDLDLNRSLELTDDYKNRVYLDRMAFISFKKDSQNETPETQIYLYIKKNTPRHRINRLLGHFVFSQFSSGGNLFQKQGPQSILNSDIAPYLESLIPKRAFALETDMNVILHNLMFQISQHEKQISDYDVKLLKAPEHRILQRFVKAVYSQSRLPFEKYGFIWGGKWNHYDTMHFEYRPEFFPEITSLSCE